MTIDCEKTVNNVEIQVENPNEEPPYVPELIRQQRTIDFTQLLDYDELSDEISAFFRKLEIDARMKAIYKSNPNRSKHSTKLHMLYALKKEFSIQKEEALRIVGQYDFTSKRKEKKR